VSYSATLLRFTDVLTPDGVQALSGTFVAQVLTSAEPSGDLFSE
jgi:hypothetical protein